MRQQSNRAAAAWLRQGPREELKVRRLTEAAVYPTLGSVDASALASQPAWILTNTHGSLPNYQTLSQGTRSLSCKSCS